MCVNGGDDPGMFRDYLVIVGDDGAAPEVGWSGRSEFESLAAQIHVEVVRLGLDLVGDVGVGCQNATA